MTMSAVGQDRVNKDERGAFMLCCKALAWGLALVTVHIVRRGAEDKALAIIIFIRNRNYYADPA